MKYSKEEIEAAIVDAPEPVENNDNLIDVGAFQLDNGIDLINNAVHFVGEVTPESVADIINRMGFMYNVNSETDINLKVSSNGGDLYALFGLIDFIDSLPVKVNVYVIGQALSSAGILLACTTGQRVVGKNSIVLFHDGEITMGGKYDDIKIQKDHMEKMSDTVLDMLVEKTSMNRDFWIDKTKNDLYLDAEQCIAFGIADRIGGFYG